MWRIVTALLFLYIPLGVAQTRVDGRITDNNGRPIGGAIITLQRGEGNSSLRTTSDSQGRFEFSPAEAGNNKLRIDSDGYYPSSYDFVLRPRQSFTTTIELIHSQSLQQVVEVKSNHLTVDPSKTGSSYTFTRSDLDDLSQPLTDTTNSLAMNLMPGASDSHDNFLAVRGTEFSLHEFINGVSFLENTQPQFSPGMSPQIFETVDLVTGGFTSEYGNRFGGVLDITTRSGADLDGHGDVDFRGATLDNYDLNADFGGQQRQIGYYLFVDGFTSGRYLEPPEPKELYDFGKGLRVTVQLDWRAGSRDAIKLLLFGGGTHIQQPNLSEDQEVGRNAQRHLLQQTVIMSWIHTISPETVLSTSVYERSGSDRVLPTADPVTPLSIASRSPFTLGFKSDLSHDWHRQFLRSGIDLVRLRESENFFFDGRGDPDEYPAFAGRVLGGQVSGYAQDHFPLTTTLTVDLGLRYDHFDLIDLSTQLSPRLGVAKQFARTKSVIHAAYNRLFSPPPIEFSLLASFIGNNAADPGQRVGNVRAYRQDYFELGWAQELPDRASLEVNSYFHQGRNPFENHEISISRIFVPINFDKARSQGIEAVLNVPQQRGLGLGGRLQYALARTCFFGPIAGGFAGDEPLGPGTKIIPAFDQTHAGTAQMFRSWPWRNIWAGGAMRYGSGSIVENGPRLPQHFTFDLANRFTLWSAESRRLEVESDITNVSNSVYKIAKESEEIPIQYSPARTLGGSLLLHF